MSLVRCTGCATLVAVEEDADTSHVFCRRCARDRRKRKKPAVQRPQRVGRGGPELLTSGDRPAQPAYR